MKWFLVGSKFASKTSVIWSWREWHFGSKLIQRGVLIQFRTSSVTCSRPEVCLSLDAAELCLVESLGGCCCLLVCTSASSWAGGGVKEWCWQDLCYESFCSVCVLFWFGISLILWVAFGVSLHPAYWCNPYCCTLLSSIKLFFLLIKKITEFPLHS